MEAIPYLVALLTERSPCSSASAHPTLTLHGDDHMTHCHHGYSPRPRCHRHEDIKRMAVGVMTRLYDNKTYRLFVMQYVAYTLARACN